MDNLENLFPNLSRNCVGKIARVPDIEELLVESVPRVTAERPQFPGKHKSSSAGSVSLHSYKQQMAKYLEHFGIKISSLLLVNMPWQAFEALADYYESRQEGQA